MNKPITYKLNAYPDKDYKYPIIISDSIQDISNFLDNKIISSSNIIIFVDDYISDLSPAKDIIKLIREKNKIKQVSIKTLKSGKHSKNLKTLEELCQWLLSKNVQRDSIFVAIGGGVIGDLVGFLASVYFRGVSLIHIPTNILSMCDSSIGGKTALNTHLHVNTLGTYKHPVCNLIYTKFLDTLSIREFSSGIAEIIKIAFLKDGPLFSMLESYELDDFLGNESKTNIAELLKYAIEYKLFFTSNDIYENSKRLFLNIGHTFGHAIESCQDLNKEEYYRHGEAVALGLICALSLSDKLYQTNNHSTYLKLFRKYKLPTKISKDYKRLVDFKTNEDLANKFASIALKDKKGKSGYLRIILLSSIFSPIIYKTNDFQLIKNAFSLVID